MRALEKNIRSNLYFEKFLIYLVYESINSLKNKMNKSNVFDYWVIISKKLRTSLSCAFLLSKGE